MIDDLPLFLIVLTAKAEEQLDEKGWLDDLQERVRLKNIRLYRRDNKKDSQDWVIAMPLANRQGALLLRQDEEDYDYFVCIGIYPYHVCLAEGVKFYHELPGDVECRIVDSDEIENYLEDAIDCDGIVDSVSQKAPWDPALGAEGKKWRAYLDMHRSVLEKKRFDVLASNIKVKGKMAAVALHPEKVADKEIADKVGKAYGEDVHFALALGICEDGREQRRGRFGKIKEFNPDKCIVRIELDKKYVSELTDHIRGGNFFAGDSDDATSDNAALFNFADNLPNGALRQKFYYDAERTVPAFSCLAKKVILPTGKSDDNDGEARRTKVVAKAATPAIGLYQWRIDPRSIEVHRMMLFADFVGGESQIKTMNRGLHKIALMPIWDVLSNERVAKLSDPVGVNWDDNSRLNPEQKKAVEKALGAPELCLIWGPPGTGKTEVIMEIARQEALRDGKTLIASQANLAVDNAIARLHGCAKAWPLRISKEDHEMQEEDKKKVPEQQTAGDFFVQRLRERLKRSITENSQIGQLRKRFATRLTNRLNERRQQNAKNANECMERETIQLAKLYHRRINVVGATLMRTGKDVKLDTDHFINAIALDTGIKNFDTVIVDEVSKATPPELFLPALRGGRLVLVGDHKQLPPMLELDTGDHLWEDEWAEKVGVPKDDLDINSTLFERLWNRHKELPDETAPVAKLTRQYRMHKNIQALVEQFYDDDSGTLECGLSEEEMAKMPIAESGLFAEHAVWIDTDDNAMERREGTSFVNHAECGIVQKLLAAIPGNKNLSVGVITFYGAQLAQLRKECEGAFAKKFDGGLFFGTVDRFQGRECDVIICSLVRKNKKKNKTIGFAKKTNRINVAFSRARKLLCIVGNSGQFCYASKARDAREAYEAYKNIYKQCHRILESDIPNDTRESGADTQERKRGDNAKK